MLVFSESFIDAVKSAEKYFNTGLSVENMKQFAKKMSIDKTFEFLNGGVIDESGVFNSQNKLSEHWREKEFENYYNDEYLRELS